MEETLRVKLNGKPASVTVDGERKLLWVLRTDLGLTGTKYGCGEGLCGACTVLVNGEAVRSCQTSMKEVKDAEIVTIEGLASGGALHPVQKAFMAHDAMQCGYCTPGMIMNAYALLRKNPRQSAAGIAAAMEDNLCRCGAHNRILKAVLEAAHEMQGGL